MLKVIGMLSYHILFFFYLQLHLTLSILSADLLCRPIDRWPTDNVPIKLEPSDVSFVNQIFLF